MWERILLGNKKNGQWLDAFKENVKNKCFKSLKDFYISNLCHSRKKRKDVCNYDAFLLHVVMYRFPETRNLHSMTDQFLTRITMCSLHTL